MVVTEQQFADLKTALDQALAANEQFREEFERTRHEGKPGKRDLSLQGMVGPWSGDDSGVPIQDYLNGLELVATSGNWEDRDKSLVLRMRLKGMAAKFLASRSDLKGPNVKYSTIRDALLDRFKATMQPEQFLLQLSSMKQERGEDVRTFGDRCREMGERSLSGEGSEEEVIGARKQLDKVVLTSYLNGLGGEIGRLTRLAFPKELQTAIEKARAIETELGRHEKGIFTVEKNPQDNEIPSPEEVGQSEVRVIERGNPSGCYRCGDTNHWARGCRQTERVSDISPKNSTNCYRCGRRGHIARQCRSKPLVKGTLPKKAPNANDLGRAPALSRRQGDRATNY